MAKHLEKNEVRLIGIGEAMRRTSLSRATIASLSFPKDLLLSSIRFSKV